jgi:hypothetical protein
MHDAQRREDTEDASVLTLSVATTRRAPERLVRRKIQQRDTCMTSVLVAWYRLSR